jgi:hypothetical protein
MPVYMKPFGIMSSGIRYIFAALRLSRSNRRGGREPASAAAKSHV